MSVTRSVARLFNKYLPPGERIMATATAARILGSVSNHYCVTENRFALLERSGLFSWKYMPVGFERIKGIAVDEGSFRSKILVFLKQSTDPVELKHLYKREARELAGFINMSLDNNAEIDSLRTKVCPDCDEIVKYRANKCKYCGYRF